MAVPSMPPENREGLDAPEPSRRHRWLRRLNFVLSVAWAAMIPVSVMTGWIYSIALIAAASIYASFVSHLGAWRAAVPNRQGSVTPAASASSDTPCQLRPPVTVTWPTFRPARGALP